MGEDIMYHVRAALDFNKMVKGRGRGFVLPKALKDYCVSLGFPEPRQPEDIPPWVQEAWRRQSPREV